MTWRGRVSGMFDRAREDVRDIAEIYVDNVVEDVVKTTPGPGLQYPLTEYIAVGRLRGGWRGGTDAPSSVSQMDGGPLDEDGDATVAAVMASFHLEARFQVWNVVGYGFYVYHGVGPHKHIGPRLWIDEAAMRAPIHFRSAVAAVARVR